MESTLPFPTKRPTDRPTRPASLPHFRHWRFEGGNKERSQRPNGELGKTAAVEMDVVDAVRVTGECQYSQKFLPGERFLLPILGVQL